jgi:hypothetical protein
MHSVQADIPNVYVESMVGQRRAGSRQSGSGPALAGGSRPLWMPKAEATELAPTRRHTRPRALCSASSASQIPCCCCCAPALINFHITSAERADAMSPSQASPGWPTERCPRCGSSDIRISVPHGMVDLIFHIILLKPLRCRSCHKRFYRNLKYKARP